MTFTEQYEEARNLVENTLSSYFTKEEPQKLLFEAMRYSLLAGGKRIRPVLVLKFAEACGAKLTSVLPLACAVEMLHTYSLIHDDLPCMDNDTLRRGKPTNHVVFGETVAVLAGDALQAAAFETVSRAELPPEIIVKAMKELSFAAGEEGICGGQILDMLSENKQIDLSGVENIHKQKTASMILAAVRMGVIAGQGSERQLQAASQYAQDIGLAFQIRDDILDITSTVEELGKPIGSDKENNKSTFASLLGRERCEEIIAEKTLSAKQAIQNIFENSAFFCELADRLASRKK